MIESEAFGSTFFKSRYIAMNPTACATLVLKTSDLTAGENTTIGSMNTYGTDMTWNNIDLRTVLGNMYDEYDRFNLCLKTIAYSVPAVGAGSSQDDRTLFIRLSGLPFVNETYSQSQKVNLSSIVLTSFNFSSNVANNISFSNGKLFTFAKHQEACNIRINYTRVMNDAIPTTAVVFPNFVYIFEIYGVGGRDPLTPELRSLGI